MDLDHVPLLGVFREGGGLQSKQLLCRHFAQESISFGSTGFTTGPVGPRHRAPDPGGPNLWEKKWWKRKKIRIIDIELCTVILHSKCHKSSSFWEILCPGHLRSPWMGPWTRGHETLVCRALQFWHWGLWISAWPRALAKVNPALSFGSLCNYLPSPKSCIS